MVLKGDVRALHMMPMKIARIANAVPALFIGPFIGLKTGDLGTLLTLSFGAGLKNCSFV